MAEEKTNEQKARCLSRYYFDLTKRWWGYTWAAKLTVFLIGIPSMFLTENSAWFAVIAGVFAFLGEAASIRSNDKKSIAERLLRKLDLNESFGWPISRLEIADAVVSLSRKGQSKFESAATSTAYFASSNDLGWRRAMENLQESAWWSKHLARSMGSIILTLTVLLSATSLVLLVFFSLMSPAAGTLTTVNRIVISVLLLTVSLGLIPLARNYNSFSQRCAVSEKTATDLLGSNNDETNSAIKAWNEYHLARSTASLIPTRLWKWKEKGLNKAWNELVAEKNNG
ncbi:MAG: hypothetical protein AB7Q37_00050 [Pyrinomonadaceae bacterium]